MYTSGTTAKPKGIAHTTARLPRRRGDHAPLRVRPEARHRRVLVRGRRRLDHGPQLHRLRPALQRRDLGDVRGNAGLSGQGPLVVDRRALRRDDPLHGADCDPDAHEVGARVRGEARPELAAPPRVGRRADQPGGVDLVPRAHRRRALPDRRHVVADGDGDDHDHAAPGRDDDQARLGDEAVPRRRRGDLQRAGRGGRPRRGRLPRAAQAVAGDAARDLRRRRAVQGDVLVEVRRRLLRGRRRADRPGRRLLADRPRRRRDERVGAPHLDDRRSSRRSSITRRSPRRPSPRATTR